MKPFKRPDGACTQAAPYCAAPLPRPAMSFRSLYRHGFARVAACTTRTALADPATNAPTILAMARDCDRQACRAGGVSGTRPVRLRDQRSVAADDAAGRGGGGGRHDRRGLGRPDAAAAGRRAAAPPRRAVQLRRWPSIAACCWASCRRSTCRITASSTSRGISSAATAPTAARSPSAAQTVPFGTDLLFAADGPPRLRRPRRNLRGRLGAQPAQRRGGGGGRDGAGQSVGQQHHHRQGRDAAAAVPVAIGALPRGVSVRRRRGRRVDHRPGLGRPGLGVRERQYFGRDRTVSRWRTRRRSPISTSTCCAQERLQMGSFDTNRRRHARPFRRDRLSRSSRRADDVGFRRRIERFPFVPADVARLEQDCYEAYNIQVSGLAQRLRATGSKQGGDRHFRRAGFDPGADRLRPGVRSAGAAARRAFWLTRCRVSRPRITPNPTPGALMQSLGATASELDIRPAAKQMLTDLGHPYSDGQAGLRHHVRECAGRAAHRLSVPAGQPPRRHRDRHRRSVGTRAGLVHLWRRRPDGALQRQCRRAEDADPASDPLDHRHEDVSPTTCWKRWTRSWRPRFRRNWCRSGEGETPQSTEAKIGPYALQDFTLFYILRYGFPPSKIAFMALHAWEDPARGDWPPHFRDGPARGLRPASRSATGWRCS